MIGTHKVHEESDVDDTDVDDDVPFIDVSVLELDDIEEHVERFEHGDMSEMFNRGWMVIDVDLEDANGTMFRTRILFNEGSARAWQNHLHSDGFFGKVYDRADDMRVLASIEGASGDSVTEWVPEPGVAAFFAEHAHLADLPSLYGESFEPGACECQFTALLALALYSVRHNATHGVAGSTPSALPLMSTILRALGDPSSAAHADNTVVQVLCSDGLPLETICTFACGPYPILVESEPFDAAGGPGGKNSGGGALDWLLRTNLPLMQAVRHHRAGDDTKAMAAFREWKVMMISSLQVATPPNSSTLSSRWRKWTSASPSQRTSPSASRTTRLFGTGSHATAHSRGRRRGSSRRHSRS